MICVTRHLESSVIRAGARFAFSVFRPSVRGPTAGHRGGSAFAALLRSEAECDRECMVEDLNLAVCAMGWAACCEIATALLCNHRVWQLDIVDNDCDGDDDTSAGAGGGTAWRSACEEYVNVVVQAVQRKNTALAAFRRRAAAAAWHATRVTVLRLRPRLPEEVCRAIFCPAAYAARAFVTSDAIRCASEPPLPAPRPLFTRALGAPLSSLSSLLVAGIFSRTRSKPTSHRTNSECEGCARTLRRHQLNDGASCATATVPLHRTDSALIEARCRLLQEGLRTELGLDLCQPLRPPPPPPTPHTTPMQ